MQRQKKTNPAAATTNIPTEPCLLEAAGGRREAGASPQPRRSQSHSFQPGPPETTQRQISNTKPTRACGQLRPPLQSHLPFGHLRFRTDPCFGIKVVVWMGLGAPREDAKQMMLLLRCRGKLGLPGKYLGISPGAAGPVGHHQGT